jgi:hypothetical protein
VATTVVEIIKVTLDDGRVIECKPLKIKYLREFMTAIEGLADVADDNVRSLDILLECCDIALTQYAKGEFPKETLDELLDLPQMYRIIEGASGIVLDAESDSPN